MATLTALRAGVAANLAASINDVQVSAYQLANPMLPAIQVIPGEIEYDLAMGRGVDQWTLLVQALVGQVSSLAAQETLDALLAPSGATSVKAAIESDKTLGGAAADLRVVSSTGYQQLVSREGVPTLMAEWTVEVLAEGA